MHEIIAQVRDVLQKYRLVAQGDVVEQHQVLMDLAHVADVRHDRQSEFARHQAHGEEFGDAGETRAIGLDEMDGAGVHVVLEQDAIGHVFTERDAHRCDVGERACVAATSSGWVGSSIQ